MKTKEWLETHKIHPLMEYKIFGMDKQKGQYSYYLIESIKHNYISKIGIIQSYEEAQYLMFEHIHKYVGLDFERIQNK